MDRVREGFFILLAISSSMTCGCAPSIIHILPCREGLNEYFIYDFQHGSPVIKGRARLETPRYRVRGIFNVKQAGESRFIVDFNQSGLLGVRREDATIYIDNNEMGIYDRKRGEFYDNDSSLTLLSEVSGFEVTPEDILCIFLLSSPHCCNRDTSNFVVYKHGWKMEGDWMGRHIELRGENSGRPSEFRQCRKGSDICYTTRYGYKREYGQRGYPRRIVVERDDMEVFISLEITDVTDRNGYQK
jgi:hypothetical protein